VLDGSGIDDPPIEPVYPLESLIGLLAGGGLARALGRAAIARARGDGAPVEEQATSKEPKDILNPNGNPIGRSGNPANLITSFVEAANNVFDDALITDVLENNQIVFDKKVTQALRELGAAVDVVDEFRPEEDIINDPLMEVVRQKAASALALIEASDGRESTVEIIE
jgi:hypothetical protein